MDTARRGPEIAVSIVLVAMTLGFSVRPTTAVNTTFVRREGSDRYATAVAISQASFSAGVPVVFVATGRDFPDAMAAGPAAARSYAPILLTERDALPAVTADELRRLDPARIVVLGGPAAVGDEVEADLTTLTSGGVERWDGADRYATAATISARTFLPGVPTVLVATGTNFPDGLVAGASASHLGAPVLLVEHTAIPAPTADELTRLQPKSITVLGGSGAVSWTVREQLRSFTSGRVEQVIGKDRYATAAELSWVAYPTTASTVFVATGLDFPDALAGGAIAGITPGPLLLVPGTCLPDDVLAELDRLQPRTVVLLGGEVAVSPAVEALTPCPTAPPAAPVLVVFDGQSLNLQPVGAAYPSQLMAAHPGVPYENVAVSGTSWTTLSVSAARRTFDLGDAAVTTVLVMNGGTTDLTEGDDGPTLYDEEKTYAARARAAGFDVVIGTTTTPAVGFSAEQEARRQVANSLLVANADGVFDSVVDLDVDLSPSLSLDDPADPAAYPDGLHWSAAAAQVAAGLVDHQLAPVLAP